MQEETQSTGWAQGLGGWRERSCAGAPRMMNFQSLQFQCLVSQPGEELQSKNVRKKDLSDILRKEHIEHKVLISL